MTSLRTRIAGLVALTATGLAGLTIAAGPAAAVTDPDRNICGDGSGSTPPSIFLRNPDNIGETRGYYIRTGYEGSTDHFYITGEFTKSNHAHWWVGYAYHDGAGTYGAVFDGWVAKSHESCA